MISPSRNSSLPASDLMEHCPASADSLSGPAADLRARVSFSSTTLEVVAEPSSDSDEGLEKETSLDTTAEPGQGSYSGLTVVGI